MASNLTVTVIVGDDAQYTETRQSFHDGDRSIHGIAVLLARCISAVAATRNDRDLDRISDVVGVEVRKIFADERAKDGSR